MAVYWCGYCHVLVDDDYHPMETVAKHGDVCPSCKDEIDDEKDCDINLKPVGGK